MAASGQSDALEAALDELYGADPSEFVAARKRLAADLRTAGEKDAAKTLQSARRPTTAAWALNQLSRHEPELVESFLEAGRELQATQMGARDGGREAMRDATRAHRDALAAATDAALAALESRATDAYRSQILATLHAASVDDAVGEQLQQGRLIREITGSTGFPEGPGLTLVPDLESAPEREPPKRAARDRSAREDAAAEKAKLAEQQRLERERVAAEELAQRRAEAETAWQAAQDEVTEAESAAQTAHEQVEQLEQDLDRVRREVRAADDRAANARRDAARLARAVMKLSS